MSRLCGRGFSCRGVEVRDDVAQALLREVLSQVPLGFFEDGVDCLEDVGADRAFFVRVVMRVEEVDAAAFLDGKVDVEEANVLCRAGELVAWFAALGAEDVCLFEECDDFADVAGVGADATREVFGAERFFAFADHR